MLREHGARGSQGAVHAHAIATASNGGLAANRPALDNHSLAGHEVHEGYADGTAFFTAMENQDVRANVLKNLQNGSTSNMASNMSEGYWQMLGHDYGFTASQTMGDRDLAAPPPPYDPKAMDADPHVGGLKMSHASYQSVLDVYQQMRKDNPTGNQDDQLKQASQQVGHDFARAGDFLPQGNHVGQGDFAAAMIKADKTDQQGQYADIYAKNFKAARVQPADTSQNDAKVAKLAQDIMAAREDKNTPPDPPSLLSLGPETRPWTPKDGLTPPITPGGTPGYQPLPDSLRLDVPKAAVKAVSDTAT